MQVLSIRISLLHILGRGSRQIKQKVRLSICDLRFCGQVKEAWILDVGCQIGPCPE
jgi:hypothetical protein